QRSRRSDHEPQALRGSFLRLGLSTGAMNTGQRNQVAPTEYMPQLFPTRPVPLFLASANAWKSEAPPMFETLARGKNFLLQRTRRIPVRWILRDDASWLAQKIAATGIRPKRNAYSARIEALAAATNDLGPQPLWEGYGANNRGGGTRTPAEVR